jgi:hypothetical protein
MQNTFSLIMALRKDSAEYKIMEAMGESLVPDVCNYIMQLVEEHHIDLGRIKWRINIEKIHIEYYKRTTIMYENIHPTIEPEDYHIHIINVVFSEGQEPPDFDHDYSVRLFNHRDITIEGSKYLDAGDVRPDYHFRVRNIANVMKKIGTGIILPKNYYYQQLYL